MLYLRALAQGSEKLEAKEWTSVLLYTKDFEIPKLKDNRQKDFISVTISIQQKYETRHSISLVNLQDIYKYSLRKYNIGTEEFSSQA